MFKCPYCSTTESLGKIFNSWEQVGNHSRFCKMKTKEYHVSAKYGPIHYSEFFNTDIKSKYPLLARSAVLAEFKKTGMIAAEFTLTKKITQADVVKAMHRFYNEFGKTPTSKEFATNNNYPSDSTVKRLFGTWNKAVLAAGLTPTAKGNNEGRIAFTKEEVIQCILGYYNKYKEIPSCESFYSIPNGPRDFHIRLYFGNYTKLVKLVFSDEEISRWNKDTISEAVLDFYSKYANIQASDCISANMLPSIRSISKHYGTFNNMLKTLDIPITIKDGCYGAHTMGIDGHLYRSKAEALFVQKYLYNKYTYEIEPKYPEPYYKIYDWYVQELDLYIELDGGCRPIVIQDKISINQQLKRNLAIIPITAIPKYQTLTQLIEKL